MSRPDLNLLVALDVLLAEGSVARAAKRLQLSSSAMSRTLARLRETTGDPLLVRAGRRLVPTPRALELRARVGQLVHDAQALLRPAEEIDLERLVRTFTLRTSEGFVETFGPSLIARVGHDAPHVRLRFMQKVRQGKRPASRRHRRPRDRRRGRDDRAGDACTGVVPRPFRRRGASGAPPEQGRITRPATPVGKHISVSRGGLARNRSTMLWRCSGSSVRSWRPSLGALRLRLLSPGPLI